MLQDLEARRQKRKEEVPNILTWPESWITLMIHIKTKKNTHLFIVDLKCHYDQIFTSWFLWMLLHVHVEQHPLCHHMCKVIKETSGANKIMRNAIDLTSILFRLHFDGPRVVLGSPSFPQLWTGLNDHQEMAASHGVFIWPRLGQNLSEMTAELLLRWRK